MAALPRRVVVLGALLLLCLVPAPGRSQTASEYAVKGAFVYNVMNFVQWPAASLPAGSPIAVAVVSSTPLADLAATLSGRAIGGRSLRVQAYRPTDAMGAAQVVFVAADSLTGYASVATKVAGQPVLTISDGSPQLPAPAMINLATANARLVFDVNLDAADAAGLQMSAKLLSLARHVYSTRNKTAR